MKLLNLKSALVGLMVVAMLSLNFVNPFSSQSYDDVKGIAHEIPVLATCGQLTGESAATPAVATVTRWVIAVALLATPTITATFGAELSADTELLDGSSKVRSSSISLSKLD